MDARIENEHPPKKSRTTVERKSEREIVVTRTVNGPVRLGWWVPKSFGMSVLSCEMDVRTGGKYRLVFAASPEPMAFFGTYVEVTPLSRIVWTNEEAGDAGAVTTVTFEEKAGKTLIVVHDLHPSKEALDAGLGAYDGMSETFEQLDEVLVALAAARA
jgi:uncharacterized protein YndB with AHSA1/START domain